MRKLHVRSRTWGAPLSFCLRVWKRARVAFLAPSAPAFTCEGSRSLQSVPTRWYGSLSDYGRCVFGSGTDLSGRARFSHRMRGRIIARPALAGSLNAGLDPLLVHGVRALAGDRTYHSALIAMP